MPEEKLLQLFEKKSVRVSLGILVALDILLWLLMVSSTTPREPELYFLSVGQGDSQLIVLPEGQKILIDAGPGGAVVENLSKILGPQETYIDLLVMTHPQLDHFGGFLEVIKRYRVGRFISSGSTSETAAYVELRKQLSEFGVPESVLAEGDLIGVGAYGFSVLGPSRQELQSKELNDTTLVLMFHAPGVRALYTGDIGFEVEERLIQTYDMSADILKVGHHGSKFSSGSAFLREVSPRLAIIGVGKNSYGHPTNEALARLKEFTQYVFRTDREGLVKVTLGEELQVSSRR